jgi:dipeptidyl aminopeptidase/acylaminoacyl peptidase
MNEPRVAPYGSWKSPITSDLIVSGTIGLGSIALAGADTHWIESRPAEEGRNVLVRRTPDGRTVDVTPPPFNVRTRVHEYGGGAYTVNVPWPFRARTTGSGADGGTIYFANFADQRLYRQDPGAAPEPLTPDRDLRYADGVIDQRRERMIWVREDHTAAGREAINTIVSLPLVPDDGGQALVAGNDFYAAPRLSPDGSRLAWLTWNHPNMPWDGCELWVGAVLAGGSLGHTTRVAGGVDESIFQPEWSPDGMLHFVSDRTGWWNLYRWRDGQIEPLYEMEAEFGKPYWTFGTTTYAFASARQIICAYTTEGTWHLARLDTVTRRLESIAPPYSAISSLHATPERAVFVAASPVEMPAIIELDLATDQLQVLRRSSELTIDPGYLSIPEAIEFPTEHGLTAHAFFYPPRNRDYIAPAGERPPLLVMSHGGPTSASTSELDLQIQYWTSRGIAVLDVNYGGSTGYGRGYREHLRGQWGIVDVDDCVNGARYLVQQGLVDGNRLAITGGSAGGYTTLCALTFRDTFKAGASYYGVSDLEVFVGDTHKFESRYLDGLIGPYPEHRTRYYGRSAANFTDRLSCPVIFFQGLEDKIVPPNQAELMVAALRAKGLPVAYIPFAGEQHGFRRAANIKRALDAELYFYARMFGFTLADPVEPVPIENLGE